MSADYEVFGDEPICKYSGVKYDPAGGHDMTCLRLNIPGTLYCHSKCEHYEPRTQDKQHKDCSDTK